MTPVEELKLIFKRHRWAAEELVYDQKLQEATALCGESANSIFVYLKQRYGGTEHTLGVLRALLRLQDGPRKALGKGK